MTENGDWLNELCRMLHPTTRLDVRLTASSNVMMLTGSDEGRLFIRQNKPLVSFCSITLKILKISTGHKQTKNSLHSKLQFGSICSVRNRFRTRDIFKKLIFLRFCMYISCSETNYNRTYTVNL